MTTALNIVRWVNIGLAFIVFMNVLVKVPVIRKLPAYMYLTAMGLLSMSVAIAGAMVTAIAEGVPAPLRILWFTAGLIPPVAAALWPRSWENAQHALVTAYDTHKAEQP